MQTDSSNGVGPLLDIVRVATDDPSIVGVKVTGRFHAAIHRRDGPVEDLGFLNGVCNLGFNLMLDSIFRNAAATLYPYWFVGLVSSTSFTSGLAAADTMASHGGWTEDSTHYTPTVFTALVNNSGGYSSSATTMAIDTISQAIPSGTPFTVAGSSLTHTVLSSVGGGTPTSITFTPGLSGAVADNATISFNNGRQPWVPGAAATKSITNGSAANFPMNNDNTVIKGIFVVSDPTPGGTGGLLWSAGLFGSDQTLFNGDTLKITYSVTLS